MAKVTAYVGELDILLTPLSLTGKAVPIRASEKEMKFVSICPECNEKVEQFYTCDHKHGPFKQGVLAKAKEVEKKLIPVPLEEVKAAKESALPLNELELSIYKATDVEAATYPGTNCYVFYPKKANQVYGALFKIISDPQYAFVGVVNLKHHEKFMRLQTWEDHLVIQELLYTEDLNEVEPTPAPQSEEFVATMSEFVTKQVKAFDPILYRNNIKAKVLALTASNAEAAGIPMPKKQDSDADALEQLKAFLEKDKVLV